MFVVLNIPPVCCDFPILAMRAILERTPGRLWRQSGSGELKKTFKISKEKYTQIPFIRSPATAKNILTQIEFYKHGVDIKFATIFNKNTVKPWITGGAPCLNNSNLLLPWRHIIKDKLRYKAISSC